MFPAVLRNIHILYPPPQSRTAKSNEREGTTTRRRRTLPIMIKLTKIELLGFCRSERTQQTAMPTQMLPGTFVKNVGTRTAFPWPENRVQYEPWNFPYCFNAFSGHFCPSCMSWKKKGKKKTRITTWLRLIYLKPSFSESFRFISSLL